MNLREVKQQVSALSPRQLVKLDAWIHTLLEGAERADNKPGSTAERRRGRNTYRRELVRCGKKECRCAEGQLHGPYWYAYWSEGGRTRSQYVGKKLPKGVRRRVSRPKVSDNLR